MSHSNPSLNQKILPKVVIVGGGCGGIAAAKALKKVPVQVILFDKVNHYLFQALLYQVATSVLDAGDIAFSIREVLHKQKNVMVGLAEITGVNKEKRCVYVNPLNRSIPYDYLILSTGVEGSYFGHDEWTKFAPGLKTRHPFCSVSAMLPPNHCVFWAKMQYSPYSFSLHSQYKSIDSSFLTCRWCMKV